MILLLIVQFNIYISLALMISDEAGNFLDGFSSLTYSEYLWHIQKFKYIFKAAVFMG